MHSVFLARPSSAALPPKVSQRCPEGMPDEGRTTDHTYLDFDAVVVCHAEDIARIPVRSILDAAKPVHVDILDDDGFEIGWLDSQHDIASRRARSCSPHSRSQWEKQNSTDRSEANHKNREGGVSPNASVRGRTPPDCQLGDPIGSRLIHRFESLVVVTGRFSGRLIFPYGDRSKPIDSAGRG